MELRAGAHTFDGRETLIMAVPPRRDLAAARSEAVAAARRAVAAGARLIELGPVPAESIAAVRAEVPDVAVAAAVTTASAAREAVDAGAALLIGPVEVAAVAAATGAGYAGPEPEAARAAGVPPERYVLDRSGPVTTRQVERLVNDGHRVMITPAEAVLDADAAVGPEEIAVAAVAVWLGARVIRTADVATMRQVVDMVDAIKGTRQPAVSVRALA